MSKNLSTEEVINTFPRIQRLPPYVFAVVAALKAKHVAAGDDVIDFGMGNPDGPTPPHIVQRLIEAISEPESNRYSESRGITPLREAICQWYQTHYEVQLDPETEAIVTIGSKDGLSHLAMAMVDKGDTVIVPDPAYPIHEYGFVIAGASICQVPLSTDDTFFEQVENAVRHTEPKPKILLLNFPSNPTAACVDLSFFEKAVAIAKKHGLWIIQDLAYADLVFDGQHRAPSILQVPGAKDVAVETYSLSKSYNMPGWRVGFVCGNHYLIAALARVKSYLDYGLYTPIQHAAVAALTGPQDCVASIRQTYQKRRDLLCTGLNALGWPVAIPRATMFVWAKIPERYRELKSLAFSKLLLEETCVAVSPGIGFGRGGDDAVRIGLIQSTDRIEQALTRIEKMMR